MAEDARGWPREAVIDTCRAAAWVFNEPHTVMALRAYRAVTAGDVQAFVPSLFWAEFQQVCAKKLRPPSAQVAPLSRADVEAAWSVLASAPLVEIPDVLTTYRDDVRDLVMAAPLNAYDACFVAMASDLELPVLTLDASFHAAAESAPGLSGVVRLVGSGAGQ